MVRHTLVINGIMGRPSLASSWTDRRARHIQIHTDDKAVAVENSFWFIRTQRRLKHYAKQLAYEIRQYNHAGIHPHIEAHSNGNVLYLMALSLDPALKIGHATMLFPAAFADCEDNGINLYFKLGQIQSITFVGSKNDKVVKWGGGLTKWLRKIGPWGYGTMSVDGLRNLKPQYAGKVRTIWKNKWGHSDFSKEGTMQRFFDSLNQAPNL